MKSQDSIFLGILIGILLIAVPSLLIHIDAANEQFRERTQTATTQAAITSINAANHNAAYWHFTIDGKDYTGGYAMADRVKPGDLVNVRYNPQNPSQNSLGDHKPMTVFGYLWGWGITDIFILWCAFVIYSSLKRRSREREESNSN